MKCCCVKCVSIDVHYLLKNVQKAVGKKKLIKSQNKFVKSCSYKMKKIVGYFIFSVSCNGKELLIKLRLFAIYQGRVLCNGYLEKIV